MADFQNPGALGANRADVGADRADNYDNWNTEERWWRDNWMSRPYAQADRGFNHYAPAYRYGFESANRYHGRNWGDVEADLRGGWDRYEHRGQSTWDQVKDAVRDAWDHVTGHEHEGHTRGNR